MRKFSSVLGALALTLFAATSANAQTLVCVDFVDFCDGLELTFTPTNVTGTWQSFDCAGSDFPVQGFRFGEGNAAAGIVCGPGCFPGFDLFLQLVFPVSTVNLFDLNGNFLNTATISATPGACPFGGDTPSDKPPLFGAN